ncbi:MAG TPA: carboxypeptidase regulatory-like domain-containing protein [Pyrinomonadaceae bacterium]
MATVSFGQEETAATITGVVTDSAGAVVQKAMVTVTNKDTNAERKVETNDDGNYIVTPLTPGTYTVVIEHEGFKRYLQTVTLNAKDRRPIDVALETGSPTETVTITDEPPLIQESSTGQSLISGSQVRELPLVNRDFMKLTELVPGVSSDLADETALGLSNRTSISINGMRRNGVNFFIDGVNNTDGGSNITLLSTPTIDSIKEFKVLTSNYTSEVGRSGSGTVTVVTRSGGNDYHLSLYEFARNNRFNANSFFNNRLGNKADGTPKAPVPKLRYNTFGGTFSGPVTLPIFGEGGRGAYKAKDKTFFFYSEEVRRIRRATTAATATVPTAAQRNGDFSSSLGLALFRTTTNTQCTTPGVGTCTTTPFNVIDTAGNTIQARAGMVFNAANRAYVGNIISASDLAPQAVALLPIWPLPNSGTNSFTFSPVNLQNTRQEVIRVDHVFNDNHRIFGRYTHDLNVTQETGGLFQGINLPNIATTDTRIPGQVLAINFTSIINPRMVNELSYNFSQNFIGSQLVGRGRRSDYGNPNIPEFYPENNANAIPSLSITGITGAGSLQGFDIRYRSQVWRDVLTWTRGNHTFKIGGEWAFEGKNENANNLTQGSFSFVNTQSQGTSTAAPTAVALTQTGTALASFMLGRASAYSESQFDITVKEHLGRREFFAQDSWKIRPNVTFDYGVRYQYFVPATDRNNVLTAFEPELFSSAAVPTCADALCGSLVRGTGNELNGIAVASSTSPFGKTIVPSDKNNFSPRLGLAWSPDYKSGFGRSLFGENGRTVFRVGYGFYYDQIATFLYEDPTFANPPFSNTATFSGAGITFLNPAGGALGALPIRSLGGIDPNIVTPEIQQWSFGMQREVWKNAVLDVSYVGTRGDHLHDQRNINFVGAPETNAWVLNTVANPTGSTNVNSIRPFKGYGTITQKETKAISRYHGLLSQLNWRFATGSSVSLAYTFSKNMTNFTNDRDGVDAPQNPLNLLPEYAEARSSRPHIFSASYIWEMPFFQHSTSGFVRNTLGGWQISGITNLESGPPISRVLAASTNSGRNGNRAQLLGNPTGGLAGTIDPVSGLPFLYDPTAFGNPALGTYGNSGRAIFRLPGRNQTNLSLIKNFYLNKEKARYIQFRAESFNVFNHTQFFLEGVNGNVLGSSPCVPGGTAICTSTTGRPGSTRNPREFQFGLKMYF